MKTIRTLLALGFSLLAFSAAAHGATFTVNTTADSGGGSLRQALADAAALTGADTITFDPALLNGQTITLTTGELVVVDTDGVTVDASALAGGVTLSGGGTRRIFSVSTGASLTLASFTLTGGNGSGAASTGNGGAILNQGTVTANACTFSSNRAGNQGGAFANGANGVATFTRCTFSGNQQNNTGGGAINHAATATSMTLTHCTLAGNSANGSDGGGAIRNRGPLLTLSYCLIAGNTVTGTGTGPDVNSTVAYTLGGANLIETAVAGGGPATGPAPITTAPTLDPLASNGGPTQTLALQAGSAGINAATFSPATVDQRGIVISDVPDLGAFEFVGGLIVTNANDSVPGSLRAAVGNAAILPGADTITFAPALSGGTITLGSEIVIADTGGVTVDASSLTNGVTISGNNARRIFFVVGSTVALRGLTLTGGNLDGVGGAIFNNFGTLTLTRCTLSGNSAQFGGAIASSTASITGPITSSTTLTQCTLSGNTATATGGAIYNLSGLTTLLHCTVSGNTAPAGAGSGVASLGVSDTETVVQNSIIAGNGNSDVDFVFNADNSFTSHGCNRIGSGNATGDFDQPGDTVNHTDVTINLAPLGNYRGPTQTMPPLAGSPAIDAVLSANVVAGLTIDQRGAPRISFGFPDIGAVELGQTFVTTAEDVDNGLGNGSNSLREALTDPTPFGSELVRFDPTLDHPAITLSPASQITISKPLTSVDASALTNHGLKISGSNAHRIFFVSGGATVALRGLTLTGGNVGTTNFGGAIFNNGGTLALTQCTLSGNSAQFGGAVYSSTASITGPNTSSTTLTHCTLSGNNANVGGGAILNRNGRTTLTHCTVSGNTAQAGAGSGVASLGDTLTETVVQNSIISGNTNSSVDFINSGTNSFTSQGGNLIGSGNATGDFNQPGDLINNTPRIAPLNKYGGPTQTRPPLPGSPALDAATVIAGLTTDQRGADFPRVLDGDGNGSAVPDTGAVELTSPYVVTETGDSGFGTLRQAVADAVEQPGTQTITFAPGFTGPIVLTSNEIVLGSSVTIDASSLATGLTISGNNARRIFTVNSGQSVTLKKLTLTGGNGAGATSSGNGGALLNLGTLTLTDCTVSGNTGVRGGGVSNEGGIMTVTRCTFTGNTANTLGGGISNEISPGQLTVSHSTFTGNSANGASGGGGAVNNTNNATASFTHCTVSGNTAVNQGGGLRRVSGNLSITNCIVAGNTATSAPDLSGTISQAGNNFTSGDPLLAPLDNYGGPTQTMALLPGSPARDAGGTSSFTTDQRSFPIIGIPDIGAYEAGTFSNYNAWIYETLPTSTTYAWNDPVPDAQHASTFDSDGDGVTNGNEWIARTAPGTAADNLRITGTALTGGNLTFTFPSVSGRSYSLWQSDTLSGAWTNTNQPAITGTGNPMAFTITFPAASIPKRFYRVQVEP